MRLFYIKPGNLLAPTQSCEPRADDCELTSEGRGLPPGSFLSQCLKLGVSRRHCLQVALIITPKADLSQCRSEQEMAERAFFSIKGGGIDARVTQGNHPGQCFLGNKPAQHLGAALDLIVAGDGQFVMM